MFSPFRVAPGLALLLSLVMAAPVLAGGWAVITLDELPTGVVAGQPLTVGFTVLQHGRTPMNDLTPAPTVTSTLDKETQFVVEAKPDGKAGHYSATLTFPRAGDWQWSVQAFTMDQRMPTLSVGAALAETANQPAVTNEPFIAPGSTLWMIRGVALAVGLVGLVVAYRRKRRLAVALIMLSVVIGVASFVVDSSVPVVEAQSKPPSSTTGNSSISQIALGQQLFVAKGCITCHTNRRVALASEYWTVDAGPDLSNFSASAEALRLRLQDPASVKSDTQMPDLNLSDAEIESLIAFINSK